jgi:hypothetical protein
MRWLVFLLLAGAAHAEGTLRDRIVTFSVLAYDDPLQPIFEGAGQTVAVGDGIEFGIKPGGLQNGVDVAAVQVDIGPARVEVRFREPPGYLLQAEFNGYVLAFVTDCALFEDVQLDTAFTNMDIAAADVTVQGGTLYVNVAGLLFTGTSRFAIDLTVADCPLS